MDVPANVDVTLGTSIVSVRECAAYEVGSVIRLRQPAGTDLELRLAGRPFAAAEVVTSDDTLSVRINRILPPSAGGTA
jgi:flagellar motor switch/type III secretory pathway protein FliN